MEGRAKEDTGMILIRSARPRHRRHGTVDRGCFAIVGGNARETPDLQGGKYWPDRPVCLS